MRLTLKRSFKLRIYFLIRKWLKLEFKESYSQIAEDIVVKHLINQKKIQIGTYVDVGCNHPIIYSNTFKLYLDGWRGVTIDLNKKLIGLHKSERKFDIQYLAPISDKNEIVDVYYFSDSLISSINEGFVGKIKNTHPIKSVKKGLQTITLNDVLNNVGVTSIDLLFIDVEGHDFSVLKSIDLNKYTPKIIIIELHDLFLEDNKKHPVVAYLKQFNYTFNSYCIVNAFFVKDK